MLINEAVIRDVVGRLHAAAKGLKQAAEVQPLVDAITPVAVLHALIAGAPPSPCEQRTHELLQGGLPGLRAFVHLATEAAIFAKVKANPFVEGTELEKRVAEHAGHLTGEERVLARHRAMFADNDGQALWLLAHADAFDAEQELLGTLFAGLKQKTPANVLFWFDPGATAADIKANAKLLGTIKRAPEKPSVKRPSSIKHTYNRLLEFAPPSA